MKRLVLTLFALLASATPALAQCPTKETAPRGFTLFEKGKPQIKVTRIDGDVVHVQSLAQDQVYSATYYHGIWALDITRANQATTQYEYSVDYKSFAPIVGREHRFDLTVKAAGQADVKHQYVEKIVAEDSFKMGACEYKTLLIERQIKRLDNDTWSVVMAHYSPDLRIPIRSTLLMPGFQRKDYVYDEIRAAIPE
jgi:hypothetical protein